MMEMSSGILIELPQLGHSISKSAENTVQAVLHRIYQEVNGMNIINTIEILKDGKAGEEYLLDDLPEDKRKRIAEQLNMRALEAIGYRKVRTA